MARVLDTLTGSLPAAARPSVVAQTPAYQAYLVLYAGFAASLGALALHRLSFEFEPGARSRP